MINFFIKIYPIVPLILFTITLVLLLNTYNKTKNYIESEGTIVDFYKSTYEMSVTDNAVYSISPVISYNAEGKEYRFKGNYYSTSMKKGDKIKIMYNKSEPSQATIKSGLIFAPIIVGILFVVSVIPVFIFKFIL